MKPFVGTCAALTFSLALTTPGAAQDLPSTRELTALPPRIADQTVRKDLLSVLTPLKQKISSGMLRRLRSVGLSTRPYGTEFPGLCELDVVDVKYAPTDVGPASRDQPLQAYGAEGHALFHALRPLGPPSSGGDRALGVWNAECGRISGHDSGPLAMDPDDVWFEARDAQEAAKVINLLQRALEQMRSHDLRPDCKFVPAPYTSCDQFALGQADVGKIDWFVPCPYQDGEECYVAYLAGGPSLTIVAKMGDDPTIPLAIESVSVAEYVVVS